MQAVINQIKWIAPAIRLCLLVWAVSDVYQQAAGIVPLGAVILLICIDVVRLLVPALRNHPGSVSLAAIALCVTVLVATDVAAIQIYYFFVVDEIFDIPAGWKRNTLTGIHFAGFMGWGCYSSYIVGGRVFLQDPYPAFSLVGTYALLLFVFAVIHYYKQDRDEFKALNVKLMDYSLQEREYAAADERNRISQELHDSLGHTLMAALMNVRYLKAIQQDRPEEARAQIDEVEGLLQECTETLRTSVHSLRKLDQDIDLRGEITRMTHGFEEFGFVKIALDYDDAIDGVSGAIKWVLYRTIREGVTNSLQHGNATFIGVSIDYDDGRVELGVRDNGSGCADIQASYGLNGIVERVERAGGNVRFSSAAGQGFSIEATLPEEGSH